MVPKIPLTDINTHSHVQAGPVTWPRTHWLQTRVCDQPDVPTDLQRVTWLQWQVCGSPTLAPMMHISSGGGLASDNAVRSSLSIHPPTIIPCPLKGIGSSHQKLPVDSPIRPMRLSPPIAHVRNFFQNRLQYTTLETWKATGPVF